MMDITLITSYFESPIHSNRAPYNEQLFLKLKEKASINIIRPISFVERLKKDSEKKNQMKGQLHWNDIPVLYPAYYFIPRVGHWVNGYLYYLSIYKTFYSTNKIPDVFFSSWAYPDGYATKILAKKHSRPLVISVLGSDINVLTKRDDIKEKIIEVLLYASAIFSPSEALRKIIIDMGIDEKKVHVIYSGINSERFYPKEKSDCEKLLGLPVDKKRVIYIGNFKIAKGVIDYLKGVAAIAKERQDFEAVLIGKGEDESLVKETIKDLKIESVVRFVGEVNHQDLNEWINSADCLCLPSYAEGLPNVILEALKTNTNVVATNVGGIPEAIQNAENYLFNPGDIEQLTKHLHAALFDRQYQTLAKFDINSYDEMANKVFKLIDRVVGGQVEKNSCKQ